MNLFNVIPPVAGAAIAREGQATIAARQPYFSTCASRLSSPAEMH